ncbi:MAG TPA: beta-propeller fold lactonase family protein [Stellaceae bacterium]|nr:beta-propeller fold lactonase family protein [Stellaceae bacterium]
MSRPDRAHATLGSRRREDRDEEAWSPGILIGRRRLGTLLAGALAAPRLARAQGKAESAVFYSSVGPDLTLYHIDVAACTLARQSTATMPANVQYAWRHPTLPVLYVASSNGASGFGGAAGDKHHATAWRIDQATGALAPHGDAAALRSRPIHLSVDRAGAFVLIAYNNPSAVSVHEIKRDGTIGAEVAQQTAPDAGIYAHQIRTTPDNAAAIVVTRGNDATASRKEDPGALKLFQFSDGQLTGLGSIAPGGGLGFGPRHLDFHPTEPWVYVSLERQSRLALFPLNGGRLAAEPAFSTETLAEPGNVRPRQLAGTVYVHPNDRFVYVANRSDAMTEFQGKPVALAGGENNLAVFALAPDSGEPRLIQHIETHGFHPRTFALDPTGRMLVAANLSRRPVRDGDSVRLQPATLAAYHVGDDGRLAFERSYDIDTGDALQFWSGMVALA